MATLVTEMSTKAVNIEVNGNGDMELEQILIYNINEIDLL